MKTQQLLFVIAVLLLVIIAGCSDEKQKIKVQKLVDNRNDYEDFKEVTDDDEVQKVKEILLDIEWENAKVEMEHPADYRFIFQYQNPNIEAKAPTYKLWISSNHDIVEIVMEENSYAKLNDVDSSILIEILTKKDSPN